MLLNLFRKKPKDTRHAKGQYGENIAARFLKKEKQYKVLSRNWTHRHGEIDIICEDKGCLVFVEVKARAAESLQPGFYAVTSKKRATLRQACKAYLNQLRLRPSSFRFDIIEIRLPINEKENPIIHHYINSPLFSKDYR